MTKSFSGIVAVSMEVRDACNDEGIPCEVQATPHRRRRTQP
jgi:hypothetical protein